MKANTPQPICTSNRLVSSASVPGGPSMNVAVTGNVKPLVRTAIAIA